MRFFVTGDVPRQKLINALILMFLGYTALLCVSNALMYFSRMSLYPDSVIMYYAGSEADFMPPKSYDSLLEITHFHLFAMGMLILTLTHLMLMTNLPTRLKIWLSAIIYLSALADELAGWLIRFIHPGFAYFKIASFLTLEIALIVLVIVISLSLIQSRYRQH
jgi:hypothetical protein